MSKEVPARARQMVLPVFDKFVFFDWFGTLSTSRFWEQLLVSDKHPLSQPMRAATAELFSYRKHLVRKWMLGKVSDGDIVRALGVELPSSRYNADYLERELLRSCRQAAVLPRMAELVSMASSKAFIGIASDNMGCFAKASPWVLESSVRVDELLVSSELGIFKRDDPDVFFGPTLATYGLSARNALLIDDCAETCNAFEAWGGTALHFVDAEQASDWLGQRLWVHDR